MNESACLSPEMAGLLLASALGLWVDCGNPSAGVVAAIRKKTKQHFKRLKQGGD